MMTYFLTSLTMASRLKMLVYKMLKRHFGREDYYMKLVDLFLEATPLSHRVPAHYSQFF